MNIRTTLMLMAATAAPLYAQQAAGSPAEQVLARLAAPAQAPAATAQQRAAALPALSHVPADCEVAFSVCNIGDTASKMAAAGMFGTLDEPLPAPLVNLDSFAFAASEGLSDFIMQLFPIMAFGGNEIFDEASDEWRSNAKEAFAKIIELEAEKAKNAASKASIASLPKAKLRPIYAVLTAKPGKEAMMEQWFGISVNNLQENADSEQGLEAVETNGFKGISFRLPEKDAQPSEFDSELEKAFKAERAKRTFYVLLKMEGNALVGVICENPDEINLPKKPEESILGTNKLAGCDARLNAPILITSYASPKFANAYAECQLAPYRAAVQTTINIFNALAKDGGADKQAFTAAAEGIDTLSQLLFSKLASNLTQSEFHQIWLENGSLEAECKLSANKDISYIPGKLRLAGMAQNPSTILYAENTGAVCKTTIPWNKIIDSAADISNGFIRTLKDGQQAPENSGMGIVSSFIPDVKNAISAAVTIHEGLGGSTAFIVDSAGSIPSILGGKSGNTTAMPRLALYSGVKDRSKIGNGWDQLLGVAGNVATRLGADPGAVQMLPIVPKETGDTTSYSVAMPWFTKDLVPNVALNDGHFAMGTSSELNERILASATGSTPFTGAVCTLKFKPLADTLDGIATMLREKADAAKAADEEEQASLAQKGGEEDDYEEPDYGDYFAYEEPSPEEKAANKAETFASVAKWFATHADSLYATHTIGKDTQTMRISITAKK